MSVILAKSLVHENQSLEIRVKYDPKANEVSEIKSIWLITHEKQIPVGNLMMKFFEPAINKIIDETDWREVHRGVGEDEPLSAWECLNNVFEVLASHFEPQKYYVDGK